MPAIHFLDVTNRDGVQTARTGLSKFGKIMVNFYLGKLGVAQSELGFPFLFHEVPYIRASVALAEAGAFGELRLSGWCRAVPGDVEAAIPLGLRHYNLSISTSDQMITHKFRGKLDRDSVISEMVAAVRAARDGGAGAAEVVRAWHAMAAAATTFSERIRGRMGMSRRLSAAAWTLSASRATGVISSTRARTPRAAGTIS